MKNTNYKTFLLAMMGILLAIYAIGAIVTIKPEIVSAKEAFPDLQSFYKSNLTSSLSSSATTITVGTAPNVDTAFLVIEPRTVNQEIVKMTSKSGTTLTIVRGLAPYGSSTMASTSNKAHAAGVSVEMADVHYYTKMLQEVLSGATSTPGDFIVSGTTTLSTANASNLTATELLATNATITSATGTNLYISGILDIVTAIINVLTTGSLTVTTSATLPDTTFTGTPTWETTPSGSTDLANKGYVDSVAIAGAASSTETQTGIVRLATKAQAAAGTSEINGNRYVLPASIATSSSDVATTSVVVTNTNGKINSSFFDSNVINTYAFGDGYDGDVTINAGSTTTLTRDMFYNNLTVNGTLVTNGWMVFTKNTTTGSGVLMTSNGNNGLAGQDGNPGGGAGGGAAGLGGTSTVTSSRFVNTPGANGGAIGYSKVNSAGVNGSTGGAGGVGRDYQNNPTYPYIPSPGPNGGIATYNIKPGRLYNLSLLAQDVNASGTPVHYTGSAGSGGGAGGSGGGTSGGTDAVGGGGGGAGASGGTVFLATKNWYGSFTIRAIGGNGGNGGIGGVPNGGINARGGGGGGGAGGPGGNSFVVYSNKTWSGAYQLGGGAGGTGGTATSQGTAGTNGANGLTGTSTEVMIYPIIAN